MFKRNRLTSNLFLVALICSDEDQSVLRDMIMLCWQNVKILFHSSLKLEKCTYLMTDHKLKLDKFVFLLALYILYAHVKWLMRIFSHSKSIIKRWRHIYDCYKKKLVISYNFVELCFDCSEWIVDKHEWNDHCEFHLRRSKTLLIQCNSFIYNEIFICSEYYSFCLENTTLSALTWMQKFLNQEKWKAHIDEHIEMLNDCKAIKCTHSRWKCLDIFSFVLKMKFHLQNVYCIELIKEIKRRRFNSEVKIISTRRKRFRRIKNRDSDVKRNSWSQFTYKFVNETTKLCGQHGTRTSTSSSISSKHSSSSNIIVTNEITNVTETSTSSVCTDIFDKLDPRLHDE